MCNRWNKTKKKLPKPHHECIIAWMEENGDGCMGSGYLNDDKKSWYDLEAGYTVDTPPTHWMLFPEFPNG